MSGSASRAAETAKPLMKVSSKPARSISFAESASKQHGITCSPGRSSSRRSFAAGDSIASPSSPTRPIFAPLEAYR